MSLKPKTPRGKFRFRAANAIDAVVVMVLGVALLAGKIKGVVLGPANVAVGVATLIAGVLLLAEDIGLLRGR